MTGRAQILRIRDGNEGLNALFARFKVRQAEVFEHFDAGHNDVTADPAPEDAAGFAFGFDGQNLFGDFFARGDARRNVHNQNVLDFGSVQQDFQRICIAFARCVADDVNGVGMRPCRRQYFVQFLFRFVGKLRQFAAGFNQAVNGQNARSAAVRQDNDVTALDFFAICQELHGGVHVFQILQADDSRAFKGGVINVVSAGQSARMGSRSGGSFRGTSRFDGEQRFLFRNAAGGFHKAFAVFNGFDVHENGVRIGIVGQIIQHVGESRFHGVADGRKVRKADIFGLSPVQNGNAQSTGLRNEGDLAVNGGGRRKAGVQTDTGNQRTQAVRPDNAHAVLLRRFGDLLLAIFAGIIFNVQSRRNDDSGARPLFAQHLNRIGNGQGRNAQNRQIGGFRQFGNAFIGLNAVNDFALGIDGHDVALKAAFQQVLHNNGTDGHRTV